jgi:mannitol/fructose-specific phosphotransferase system IIA component (Ntr-type)
MLAPLLHPDRCLVIAGDADVEKVFDRVAEMASEASGVGNVPQVRSALHDQEAKRSTVTPEGVAFPHALLYAAKRAAAVPVVAPAGLRLPGAVATATILFFLVGSSGDPWAHIRTLARLSRCVVRAESRTRLLESRTPAAAIEALLKEDARHG